MSTHDIFYRRNLPHYHLNEYPLFITFRLVDSIPFSVLTKLKMQREKELRTIKTYDLAEKDKLEQKYFRLYDEWLDHCKIGSQWLREHRIAQIVMKEIHELSESHYKLIAYCIMPNHVHLLTNVTHLFAVSTNSRAQVTRKQGCGPLLTILRKVSYSLS